MTDSLGQSQVLPYLAGLSQNGYKISIISCEKKNAFEENKAKIFSLTQSFNIEWHPIEYTKKPPVLSTLIDIFKIQRLTKKLHHIKKFELIHCRSYISALIGLRFKKKFNIPFVFDMRGFWADERVEGKIWNLKNPLFKIVYDFFKREETEYANHANALVSLTHAGKKEIQKWDILPAQKEKIFVIPCSADFDLFQIASNEQKQKAREELGFTSTDFVLTYLGSIGTWYLLDEMLDFFKVLKMEKPEAKFLFITAENSEFVIEKAKQKSISQNDIKVVFASRQKVVEYISCSDWGISFIKPSFSKTASSPTKMGEMLAMGIPLIVNSNVGDVQQIIEQTNGGICITKMDAENFSFAVQKMNDASFYNKEEIRKKSFEIYSLQKAINTYCEVYQIALN